MDTGDEKNQPQEASANDSALSGTSARSSAMNSMSLYERQAVQALQALQRQPHAAQYFQQLMLQQHINKAQLQNLAAVQQVQASLAAGCQPSQSGGSPSQTAVTSAACATSSSASTASNRPVGVSATTTISQSVLLGGGAGGRGQMYLRVNRSLRAPISPQLIFMRGNTATAAVATLPQLPQPRKPEIAATSSSGCQTDSDQVQNLTVRNVSGPKCVKTERSDAAAYPLVHSTPRSPNKASQPQAPPIKIPTYPQPANIKAPPPLSSTSAAASSVPLTQLLLHSNQTTAPAVTHALVLTSTGASQAHTFPVCTATIKPAVSAQTLVVQPLQKSSLGGDKLGHGNNPVPIQPKTLQGLRLNQQLPLRNPPPIMPAPTPASSSAMTPHIPVQIVGARQSTLGSSQALALARGGCSQEGAAILTSSSSLLTMVASIASRESGVMSGGVGIKALSQEPHPPSLTSKVHANQSENGPLTVSAASSQSATVSSPSSLLASAPLPLAENGDLVGCRTVQVKEATSILKRKLDEDGPSRPQSLPVKNCSSVLTSVSMETDSAPPPAYPTLPVSRSGCARREKAPPPQAVIKPHVLTHLIEGFVIQEGPEPFPVCGTIKDSAVEDQSVTTTIVLKCEYCKKFAPASQFRGTKRFCSMLCAKRYNVSFRQPLSVRHAQECHQPPRQDQLSHSDEDARVARRSVPRRTSSEIASAKIAGRSLPVTRHSESSHSDTESSGEEEEDNPMSLSPASLASCHAKETPSLSSQSSSPAHWSVDQVSQYISSLQGCEELALHFLSQEIDGQALLLLKEEHLMSTMNIKLGPALKICAHINNLRD
ncbi:polyhomeotic-like protein 1 isoform X1 [Nerophis ophidion]|uniref:polyhomeotic-like protein 1 isoform X1 n=1 Tax=Nerophis ophidion TaxID=159077 RepID=UPI002AE08D96|nr:polyhomeotic-like protein 1 isoform X1 [Nerophis ophidion]XP_061764381.1 polyhomeotic-like protein 1 isoform X1 [Nerophis ophidion]XP_061764382.1 polyhomeotic-like protein 1 isoform X1 [Nerophis ophidion]XP_061764383.1 polyhomeotic-like protein 1 isoform X1 [Nerophis ophidion]